MLKVRTLFSGIGSPESALKNLGIEFELVDFCEIDKYAVKSYCAIHGVSESKNLGDISKVWGRNLPYADLLVWGFPCTDISVAGKQAGIVEGATRSGLYYEGLRILKETMPKYSIIENVKNLTGKKFRAEFEQMLSDIDEIGYNNYWQVLNAKNYGIPQNRERVFIVSIRKDVDTGYEFPQGLDNGLRLKDFLEDEVDEKYYINQEKTEKLISQLITNGFDFKGNTITVSNQATETATETALCLLARDYKGFGNQEMNAVCIPCITPDRVEKRQNGRRFKEDGDPSFTLTSQDRHGVLEATIQKIGNYHESNHEASRIVDSEGLAPCVKENHGTVTAVMVREAEKHDASVCIPCITPDRVEKRQNGRRFKEDGDPSFTLTSQDRHGVLLDDAVRLGGIFDGEVKHQAGAVWDKEGMCPTLDTMQGGYRQPSTMLNDYRIRKLTPKECFRLMGFSDEEFQRCVDAGVSNSQLYKQAGNSIVTKVLEAMFRVLLAEEIKIQSPIIIEITRENIEFKVGSIVEFILLGRETVGTICGFEDDGDMVIVGSGDGELMVDARNIIRAI